MHKPPAPPMANSDRLAFYNIPRDITASRGTIPPMKCQLLALLAITTLASSSVESVRAAEATPAKTTSTKSVAASTNILIFRNVRSWNRQPDFEEALTELGYKFDVKPSAEMATADLSAYAFVIIPGAQHRDGYYHQYAENTALFDRYVTNGGTLLLELNGAERDGITLPLGVTMQRNGARDNALTLPKHPILEPLQGAPIHASYASHGWLDNAPTNALVLATEMTDGKPLNDRPTFIEYPFGKGRVIAACQCFHDRDGSGRGILMETAIAYAAGRKWYAPVKQAK